MEKTNSLHQQAKGSMATTSMRIILVSVLAGLFATLASAAELAPPWRGQAGSTYEEWFFNTAANPALPEIITNAAPGEAVIQTGEFSSGWVQELSGSWDLGREGTIQISLPAGIKYASLQVEQMLDGAIYSSLASITLTNASLTDFQTQTVSSGGLIEWTVAQAIWLVNGNTNTSLTITGAYNGSVISRVLLETLAEPPPNRVQLSIRRLSDGRVELSWPVVAGGSTLEWNSDLNQPQEGWQPVGIDPQISDDRCSVILETIETMRWFRVRQP